MPASRMPCYQPPASCFAMIPYRNGHPVRSNADRGEGVQPLGTTFRPSGGINCPCRRTATVGSANISARRQRLFRAWSSGARRTSLIVHLLTVTAKTVSLNWSEGSDLVGDPQRTAAGTFVGRVTEPSGSPPLRRVDRLTVGRVSYRAPTAAQDGKSVSIGVPGGLVHKPRPTTSCQSCYSTRRAVRR